MRTEGWVRLRSILKKTQRLLEAGLVPLLAPVISSISSVVEANSNRLFYWFGGVQIDFGLFNLADKDSAPFIKTYPGFAAKKSRSPQS